MTRTSWKNEHALHFLFYSVGVSPEPQHTVGGGRNDFSLIVGYHNTLRGAGYVPIL